MPSPYSWTPPPDALERSNVGRFMRRHGIDGYAELVCRSTADVEWFWDAIVQDLGIGSDQPYERLLDVWRGADWAQWFVGGRINVVRNCIERHARSHHREQATLIWKGEDG